MLRRHRHRICAALAGIVVATCLTAAPVPAEVPVGSFTAGGSINQVFTYGHRAGTALRLFSPDGRAVRSGIADAQGGFLFKGVAAGTGYRVQAHREQSTPLTVTNPNDHPDPSFYESAPDIPLGPAPPGGGGGGYGYLETRDGTTLSINVSFPPDTAGPGPWPVVVVYNGYDPSKPATFPPEALVYHYMGYVVVGVNMRGSGCSGGAYDFLEPANATDGYDVIETLANQSWSNGDIGMVGISYGGFSQLYVAATRPPHLRAITPLTPFDDAYRSTLYPGGILNDGFASDFASERARETAPRGLQWIRDQIDGGDTECERNQLLRLQSRPLEQEIRDNPYASEEFAHLDLTRIVPEIRVPTYLAAQFQDEQLGGGGVTLAGLFDPSVELHTTLTNGSHIEGVGPTEYAQAMAFIDFYVGRKVPDIPDLARIVIPIGVAGKFGTVPEQVAFPANPWSGITDYDAALRWFEASTPTVRIRWENGGVAGKEGLPYETATSYADRWPIRSVRSESRYLQPDGTLGDTAPPVDGDDEQGRSAYRYDPSTKLDRTFQGSRENMWTRHPDVDWRPLPEGDALSFLTEPYTRKTAYAGPASADLWLRSDAVDTDLEVSLTEVRPDGSEVYIQSGLLRASHRALDLGASSELAPRHTHREADARPLPRDTFEPVRVAIPPFAHVFRPGSQLRVNIEAPGGNHAVWSFETVPPVRADGAAGAVMNQIGHARDLPSRIVLPALPASDTPPVPDAYPSCNVPGVTTQSHSLRIQPCRPYVPLRSPAEARSPGNA